MMKKKANPKVVIKKNIASIKMSMNGSEFYGSEFYAEGDEAEVNAKLKAWLAKTLAPIRKIRELANGK
jgi:hypothetical protein